MDLQELVRLKLSKLWLCSLEECVLFSTAIKGLIIKVWQESSWAWYDVERGDALMSSIGF